jgi:hypothetical protein
VALAAGIAANSLLGPLIGDVIEYRYSETLINQAIGLDAISLFLVAPLCALCGIAVFRGYVLAAVPAFAPALYAAYMFPQYIVGPEYLTLPGNNESFFPPHVGLFTLALACGLTIWSFVENDMLPERAPKAGRVLGIVMFLLVAFLLARWIPGLIDVWRSDTESTEYLENPTAWWLIGTLDLGLVAPAAVATGIALLCGARWAGKATYALVGWFVLVPIAVAAMQVSYHVNDDPNATTGGLVLFTSSAVIFAAFAAWLYWPLIRGLVNRDGRMLSPSRGAVER